MSGAV